MNDYAVFSQGLAKYLCLHGFMWNRAAPSNKGDGKVTFFFTNTPDLVNTINTYKEELKNDKKQG